MGRPYGNDLRERVLSEAKRTSARAAGVRFGISPATATRWAARAQGGKRAARPWGGRRGSCLDDHAAFIEDHKDATLAEIGERLASERDVTVGCSALCVWLRKRGWTFKSVRSRIGAEPTERPEAARGMA